MDQQIPVILDEDPVNIVCEFEHTLVKMGEDDEIAHLSYAVHSMLLQLYSRQNVYINIVTFRDPKKDAENPNDSVQTYCARSGLPISAVHYLKSSNGLDALMEDLEPALYIGNDQERIEYVTDEHEVNCILIANDGDKDIEDPDGELEYSIESYKEHVADDALELMGVDRSFDLRQAPPGDAETAPEDFVIVGGAGLPASVLEQLRGALSAPDPHAQVKTMHFSKDGIPIPKPWMPDPVPVPVIQGLGLPDRRTPRSTTKSRIVARTRALMGADSIDAIVPLLDDVNELVVAVNGILVHMVTEDGDCSVCGNLMEAAHSEDCWVGAIYRLTREYAA